MDRLVVFAVCSLVVFAVTKADDLHDEKYEAMVRNACGSSRAFDEDMYTCWQKEPQNVIDAVNNCISKAISSFKATLVDFIQLACTDKDTYLKFNECYSEQSNEEPWKPSEASPQTMACYAAVWKKYATEEPAESS